MKKATAAAMLCAVLSFGVRASAADTAEKGTVTFVVRDIAGNDLDAKITIDGDAKAVPLGRSTSLEPGIHDVHWSTPNGATGTQKLTVIEGQKGRIFLITTPVNVNVNVPVNGRPIRDEATTQATPATEPTREPAPWPWILLGTGATLAVTSAIFQLVAINEDSDAQQYFWQSTRDDLSQSTRDSLSYSSQTHFDAAQADQTVAIACGVLAFSAVAAAVTWLAVGHR